MYSMTGYGKGEWKSEAFDLTVEVKSVNNRYLDFSVKAPKLFLAYEDRVRGAVKEKLTRGHVDVFVSFTDRRKERVMLSADTETARAYVEAAQTLKEAFPLLEDDLTVLALMKCPDVLKTEECPTADGDVLAALLSALDLALAGLNEMRLREGEKLREDLCARMGTIASLVEKIRERAPLVAENYAKKMTERVRQFLAGTEIDESRLLTEVAVFTDKCNIDEELTRLSSHIEQFYAIANTHPVGRKLDFLVQEFNREVNTICSKSNDLIVTECGLSLKNEIEKVREQIQNLE